MKFFGNARRAVAVGFVAGIGTIGIQDVGAGQGADADGSTDFTVRGRRRPFVERPVEPDDPADDTSPFCVLDIETTGLSPERDAIIEIAVIRSETRDGVSRELVLDELVRPSGNIPKRIRELTGITNEMVADADTIDRVLPRTPRSSAMLRSWAQHFDRRFLEHNARLMSMTFAGNEWVCTMRMAQRVPLAGPYKLTAVAERLDIPVGGSHRALDDCHSTIGVYRATPPPRRQRRSGSVGAGEPGARGSRLRRGPERSGFRLYRVPRRSAGGQNRQRRWNGGQRDLQRRYEVLVADVDAKPTGKIKKALEYGIAIQSKESFEQEFYIAQ